MYGNLLREADTKRKQVSLGKKFIAVTSIAIG